MQFDHFFVQVLLFIISILVCVDSRADVASGLYLCFAMYWLYDPRKLQQQGNRGFNWIVTLNWLVLTLYVLYQVPMCLIRGKILFVKLICWRSWLCFGVCFSSKLLSVFIFIISVLSPLR